MDTETATLPLTEDIAAALKAKHKRLKVFSLERGGQAFAVRPPSEDEFHRALDKISDGGPRKTEAILELGQACLVFPSGADLTKASEGRPGLPFTAGNKALELAGITDGYGEKNL